MIVISQTATASIMVPIVMSIGIPPIYFVAMVQTLNVNFVIPAQPTLLLLLNWTKRDERDQQASSYQDFSLLLYLSLQDS